MGRVMDFNYIVVLTAGFGVGGFLLIRLFDVPEDLRSTLIEKRIFDADNFAASISEINQHEGWKKHFEAYYCLSEKIWDKAGIFAFVALMMALAVVPIEAFSDRLSFPIDQNVNFADFLRGIHFSVLLLWNILLFVFWRSAIKIKRDVI